MTTADVLVCLPLLPEVHVKVVFQLLLSSRVVREAVPTLFTLNCSFQEELIKIGLISRKPVTIQLRNSHPIPSATHLAIPAVESSILWERSLRPCSEILLLEESVDPGCGSFTLLEAVGVPVEPTTPAFTRALYKFAISLTAGKAGTLCRLVGARGTADTGCTGGAGGKVGFTSRVP